MKTRRPQRGGTLLGLAFGLVVGVLISFVERVTQPEAREGPRKEGPVALPGKPGDKPVEKPAERKFEFYDILEGKKGAAPLPAPGAAAPALPPAAPPAVPAEPSGSAGTLYLQAGAFQKPADAENLKARLAMLGFEASILTAEVPEKGTMHRVRIGPYASTEQMNQVRGQLSQNGIPATVVRVKEQ